MFVVKLSLRDAVKWRLVDYTQARDTPCIVHTLLQRQQQTALFRCFTPIALCVYLAQVHRMHTRKNMMAIRASISFTSVSCTTRCTQQRLKEPTKTDLGCSRNSSTRQRSALQLQHWTKRELLALTYTYNITAITAFIIRTAVVRGHLLHDAIQDCILYSK